MLAFILDALTSTEITTTKKVHSLCSLILTLVEEAVVVPGWRISAFSSHRSPTIGEFS